MTGLRKCRDDGGTFASCVSNRIATSSVSSRLPLTRCVERIKRVMCVEKPDQCYRVCVWDIDRNMLQIMCVYAKRLSQEGGEMESTKRVRKPIRMQIGCVNLKMSSARTRRFLSDLEKRMEMYFWFLSIEQTTRYTFAWIHNGFRCYLAHSGEKSFWWKRQWFPFPNAIDINPLSQIENTICENLVDTKFIYIEEISK